MKRFLSVKGILLVMLLLVVSLGSGTALADRQSSVAPQDSQTRMDAATIVTSSLCTPRSSEFTVWASGFASGEVLLLSLVVSDGEAFIWHFGNVNEAGAAEMKFQIEPTRGRALGTVKAGPTAGIYTLEAAGSSGRLTTTPIVFVEDKCPGSDSM